MFEHVSIAAVVGTFPALLWLLFWVREDRRHPEPKRLLGLAFFAGALVVIPVLKLEGIIFNLVRDESMQLVWWSLTEELAKFIAAYFFILRRKEVDEPIDYVIYMIAVALGFAAFENALFIFTPVSEGFIIKGLLTSNLRFIGATLLHIVTSASIGVALGLSFYKNQKKKRMYLFYGLILAIALHTAFNLTIMIGEGQGGSLLASSSVWVIAVIILLLFEKLKKVRPESN